MNYNQFKNLSCYEEFEIQCALTGVSKIDVLKKFGNKINKYYYFISEDGIFNWFNLKGNHIKDPGILKEINELHIPKNITKCVIPNSVTRISSSAFYCCSYLKKLDIPDNVTYIDNDAFWYCQSLEIITIPNSVTCIGNYIFFNCNSLKEVIFKGKTLEEVKRMKWYPWSVKYESIIKCEL